MVVLLRTAGRASYRELPPDQAPSPGPEPLQRTESDAASDVSSSTTRSFQGGWQQLRPRPDAGYATSASTGCMSLAWALRGCTAALFVEQSWSMGCAVTVNARQGGDGAAQAGQHCAALQEQVLLPIHIVILLDAQRVVVSWSAPCRSASFVEFAALLSHQLAMNCEGGLRCHWTGTAPGWTRPSRRMALRPAAPAPTTPQVSCSCCHMAADSSRLLTPGPSPSPGAVPWRHTETREQKTAQLWRP